MTGIRFTGIASGLDTDSIIKDLMRAHRMPVQRLESKKQILTWQQEAFRDMNNKFLEFRKSIQELRFVGNFSKFNVVSSNEQAVKVTNGGVTQAGTQTVDYVSQLASYGKVSSSASLNTTPGLESNSALAASITVTTGNKSMVLDLGGNSKTITLDEGTYDQAGLRDALQSKIDSAFGAGQVTVGLNSGLISLTPGDPTTSHEFKPQLQVKQSGTSTLLDDLSFNNNQSYKVDETTALKDLSKYGVAPIAGNVSFSINGVTISAADTDTVQTVIDKVNKSSAGVTMSFDEQSGKFSFITKGTGSNSKIEFTSDPNGFLSKINLDPAAGAIYGSDAVFSINGLETRRNTNSFTIDGISYTLMSELTTPIAINVSQDSEAVLDKIKNFVNLYNDLISEGNSKLKEKRFRDFVPLTSEQKKEMSDDEVKNWEKKAKSGLLRGDTIINSALNNFRFSLSDQVEGLAGFKALSEIGITPSKHYQDNGKLEIDEAKLLKAISENVNQVSELFSSRVTNPDGSLDAKKSGFAHRMYEHLNAAMDSISKRAGFSGSTTSLDASYIGKEMSRVDKQIFNWEDKLKRQEDYYYRQFAAMEKAMNQMNSQSSWLMSQMGGQM